MVRFGHDEPGTCEQDWRDWLATHPAPPLHLPAGPARLVVLAAHPDDETLGAGGLTATAAAAGWPVDVVVATDGEASHPKSPTTTPAELASLRAREVAAAVADLAPAARVHRLGLPDGALAEHRAELAGALAAVVAPRPAAADGTGRERGEALPRNDSASTLVLAAPWRQDAHPDHEVAGEVAGEVAERCGALLLEYPVWAWHWAGPGDHRLPWPRIRCLTLQPEALRCKANALQRHRSQTAPLSASPGDEALIGPGVLAHFRRPCELFVVTAPSSSAKSSSLPSSFFEAFYAAHGTDPWGLRERWYERRKRAILLASLPRERFRRAFEPGCAIGELTLELAGRCDEVLATDVVGPALQAAAERTRHLTGVRLERRRVPQEWPDGRFDLVVLSEVGYYSAGADLDLLVRRAAESLADDGVLVACHWRHPVAEYPLTGDDVHRALRRHPRLHVLARHEEEDFVLDVLVPRPATSVARMSGLLP